MRVMGHNAFAIIVAALAIYAIEFVIFAVLIPAEQYMAFTGITQAQVEGGMARMPFGIIPPLLAAIGLSMVIKRRNAAGWMGGATTGLAGSPPRWKSSPAPTIPRPSSSPPRSPPTCWRRAR